MFSHKQDALINDPEVTCNGRGKEITIFQPLLMNCEIVVRLIWYFLTLVSVVDYEVATDLILRDSRAIETDKAVKKQMGKQNYEREKVGSMYLKQLGGWQFQLTLS